MTTNKSTIAIVAPYPSVIWDLAILYGKIYNEYGLNVVMINSRQGPLRFKLFIDLIINDYDLVNVHSSGYFDDLSLLYATITSKLKGKKVILTYHCGNLGHILKNFGALMRVLFKSVDKIITVSKYMRVELTSFDEDLGRKIVVIQNFLDKSAQYDDNYFKKKGPIVLSVGSVSTHYINRKGLKTFVDAAKHLPHLKFVLVGKPIDDSITYLKSISSNNVEFTGYISDNERDNWYKNALIYCQLSSSEGLPISLLESMSFGCVPVVTNTTSHPETIGDCGFLVPYGNPLATAKAIEKAINHPEKSICASKRFNNKFTLEKRKQELINVVKEVMNDI